MEIEAPLAYDKVRFSVFESMVSPFTAIDRDWRLLFANQAASDLIGQPLEDLIGCKVWDEWPDMIGTAAFQASHRVMAVGTSEKVVYRSPHLNAWVELQIFPIEEGIGCLYAIVDEQQEAVIQARESEAKFRILVDAIPQLVWMNDADGTTGFLNRRWLEYTGRTMEELTGLAWMAHVHPDDKEELLAIRHAGIANGEPYEQSFRLQRHDGEYRWHITRVVPLKDDDGKLKAWFGTATDIHEMKTAQEQLRVSEERFKVVLKSAPIVLSQLDRDLRYTWATNTHPLVDAADLIGKKDLDLHYHDQGPSFHKLKLEVLESGQGMRVERSVVLFGETKTYDMIIEPFRDAEGNVIGITQAALDITDRKRMEVALDRERELLQRIIDSIPVMIAVYDPATKMLRLNLEFERVTGWSIDLVEEGAVMERVYPDPCYRQEVTAYMQSPTPGWKDIVMRTRDGRDVQTSWANVRLSDGTRIGIGIDISDRKQIEEMQQELSEQRRLALEIAELGVWFFDTASGVSYLDDRCHQVFGIPGGAPVTLAEIFGRIHPEDREAQREEMDRALDPAKGGDVRTEFRILRPDGSTRHVVVRGIGEFADHLPVRFFGTLMDVTTQRIAEREAEQARQRLSLGLTAVRAGFWQMDPRSLEVQWSPEQFDALGLPRSFVPTRENRLTLIHPDDVKMVTSAVERAAVLKEPFAMEFRVVLPEGETKWIRSTARVILDTNGEVERLIGIDLDVTARRNAEDALRELNAVLEDRVKERTAALESAIAELEGFTYSVSHDLRTPLRSIVASCQILRQDYGPELSSDAKELLDRQAKAASKLGELIDELLKLSRITRYELAVEDIDLSDLARTVVSEVCGPGGRVSIEIEEGLRTRGDVRMVRFALQNLIENASKFSPKGGTVRVGSRDGAFYVSDEGVGFDMQYAHKLFRPFERLVRDDEYPGTGIGLANVERIVKRHGGRVWAESKPGSGATFFFTLG